MNIPNLSLCCLLPFHPSFCHCFKAMLLVGIFPHRVSLHTSLFFLHPLPRETNTQVGYSTFQVQVAFNDIRQKIPKKILTKFSYPKESWNQNFQTPKNPLIIPALEIWSTPLGTNINNYSFLNNTHIHQEKMFWE